MHLAFDTSFSWLFGFNYALWGRIWIYWSITIIFRFHTFTDILYFCSSCKSPIIMRWDEVFDFILLRSSQCSLTVNRVVPAINLHCKRIILAHLDLSYYQIANEVNQIDISKMKYNSKSYLDEWRFMIKTLLLVNSIFIIQRACPALSPLLSLSLYFSHSLFPSLADSLSLSLSLPLSLSLYFSLSLPLSISLSDSSFLCLWKQD